MAILNVVRALALPDPLLPETLYLVKSAVDEALLDIVVTGNTAEDVRSALGISNVQSAVNTAIENLTAAQIPDLPGSKIVSTLSVDTTGNAASATVASGLTPGASINGVSFTGTAPITISAVDTDTPRIPDQAIGVTVAPLVDGVVPREYIPANFDNMETFPTREDFPAVGRTDVIYVADNDAAKTWRWAGGAYVLIGTGGGGVADEALKLVNAQNIELEGDATGSATFDGTAAATIDVVLASVGTAGAQQPKVTTDAKGRVVSSTALVAADIPDLPGTKITSDLTVNTSGNAATATGLQQPFTLSLSGDATGFASVGGDGDVNIVVTVTGGGTTEGATGTYTKVVTEDGVVKSGSALLATDIPDLPGTKITSALTVDTSGKAATAGVADSALAINIVAEW